jgi:hypothetical protein
MSDKQPKTLWALSGVNRKGDPFVQLKLDDQILAQMTPAEARNHAQDIAEAAEAAETDAFLFDFLTTAIKTDAGRVAALLQEFRKWREARGGQRAPRAEDFNTIVT